jgi:hypothetical protein
MLKKLLKKKVLISEEKVKLPEIKVKTSYPKHRPTLDEWCLEFRVSCLHGKTIVHLND